MKGVRARRLIRRVLDERKDYLSPEFTSSEMHAQIQELDTWAADSKGSRKINDCPSSRQIAQILKGMDEVEKTPDQDPRESRCHTLWTIREGSE